RACIRSAHDKKLLHAANTVRQSIHFGFGVVQRQRRSCCRRHSKPIHHGLSAVVTCPNGDSVAIEDGANVMRVDAVEYERQDADLLAGRPDYWEAGNGAKESRSESKQFSLMSSRAVDPASRHVFQRGAKSDSSGNMGRTRLKLVGQLVVDRFLERDGTD